MYQNHHLLRTLKRLRVQFSERGITAMEMVVVLGLVVQLMLFGANYLRDTSDQMAYQNFSRQIQMVHQAAKHYAQDHYEIMQSGALETGWLTVKIPDLIDQGYLFPNMIFDANVFEQKLNIGLNSLRIGDDVNGRNVLQLITYTAGGRALPELALRQVAGALGPEGGYLSRLHKDEIIGSFKGWSLSLDSLPALQASEDEENIALTPGHVVMSSYVDERDVLDASTFLRRVKINEFMEGNVMETSLGVLEKESIELGLPQGETIDPEKSDRTRLKHGELQFGIQESKISIPKSGVLYLGDNCSLDNDGNLTIRGTVTLSDVGEHYRPSTPQNVLRLTNTTGESVLAPSTLSITEGRSSRQAILKPNYLKLGLRGVSDPDFDTDQSGSYDLSLSARGLDFLNDQTSYASDGIKLQPDRNSDQGFSVNFDAHAASLRLVGQEGSYETYLASNSVYAEWRDEGSACAVTLGAGWKPPNSGKEGINDQAFIYCQNPRYGFSSQLCSRNLRDHDLSAKNPDASKILHNMLK